MRANVAAILIAAATACSSSGKPTLDVPPTLTLTSPQRGATVDGTTVTVAGTASDDGAFRVVVNGAEVAVAKDGTFSTTVTVPAGISVVETHAIDKTGHDVRDTRAVLAGSLGPSDGSKTAPIGAHASAATLTAIGKAVATDAKAVDFTAVAQAANPVYNNGGCLGAVVNVTSVSVGNIDVALVPQANALATDVTIDNVTVKLSAAWKVACLGSTDTITVTASAAHLAGNLGVAVSGGKLTTSLPTVSVTLDNFNLSVGGIPSQVVDLFKGTVQSKIQSALQSAIESKVPGIANSKLAGLLANPFDQKILGIDTKLTATPKAVVIAPTGLLVAVDTKVAVTGGTGGMFLEATAPDPSMLASTTRNLGVAIANDLVNQLLAGLWAAGAFDKSVPIASVGVLGSLLDADAATLDVSMALPPTVQSDDTGNLQLAVGEALISVKDSSGTELQKIALSLQTGIAAGASQTGTLSLALGAPTVYAQVLGQVDDGSRPLTDAQVEGIVTGAWGLLSQQASDALGKLPLPTIAGVKLGAPTIDSVSNYVVADIPVE